MNIIYFSLIFFFNLIKTFAIISFSLNYYNKTTLSNSISSIYNLLDNSYLYTNIKIGEPEHHIKTFLSMSTPHFSMSSELILLNDKEILNYYDINKSSTFKNISFSDNYYIESINDIIAKENFKLLSYDINNKKDKEIEINDLNFIFIVKNKNIKNENLTELFYLTIGLQIISDNKYKYNFIHILKERKIIDNYNWFILYEDNKENNQENLCNLDEIINNKPKLLIGTLPHEVDPMKYNKNQLISAYSNNFDWILFFKNVYYYKNDNNLTKKNLYDNRVQIDLNKLFIYAPSLYFDYIQRDYFNDYISKNICSIYSDNNIRGYFCEKSEFSTKNLKAFPTLYFEHTELNFTFEFSYKDLFVEKENKYIFLIVDDLNDEIDEWVIGYSLLRKYQAIFNQEAKTISFYNPNLPVGENEKNENNENNGNKNNNNHIYIIYVVIALSWIIFIVIGFFIGKYFYKKYKAKKRANELDDNYEYISEQNIN